MIKSIGIVVAAFLVSVFLVNPRMVSNKKSIVHTESSNVKTALPLKSKPKLPDIHSSTNVNGKFIAPNRDDLIDSDTCTDFISWLNYDNLLSFSTWNGRLDILYNHTKDQLFMWRYPCGPSYNTKPIYYVHLTKYATDRVTFWKPQDATELLWKYPITYYMTLDSEHCLFVFKINETTDYIVPYKYGIDLATSICKVYKLNGTNFQRGSIPMQKIDANVKLQSGEKVATTFINNIDFSYSQGYLTIKPMIVDYGEVFYFGFNQDRTMIYFTREIGYFEYVEDYRSAESLVSVSNWHPFRLFDFVYVYVDEWVFIFPHLDLVQEMERFEYPLILQAQVSIMHRNTFFRCVDSKGSVQEPEYPSMKVMVLLQDKPTSLVTILVSVAGILVIAIVIVISLYKCYMFRANKNKNEPISPALSTFTPNSPTSMLNSTAGTSKLSTAMMSSMLGPNKMMQSTLLSNSSVSNASYMGASVISKYSNISNAGRSINYSSSVSSSSGFSKISPAGKASPVFNKYYQETSSSISGRVPRAMVDNNKYSLFTGINNKRPKKQDDSTSNKKPDSNKQKDFSGSPKKQEPSKKIYSTISQVIDSNISKVPGSSVSKVPDSRVSKVPDSSISKVHDSSVSNKKPKTKK